MQAVCGRAYPAALTVMTTALKVAGRGEQGETDRSLLMTMLYPVGSSLDNSPLHVLCANDTCSFTWTGAEHINQVLCGGVFFYLFYLQLSRRDNIQSCVIYSHDFFIALMYLMVQAGNYFLCTHECTSYLRFQRLAVF